MTDKTMTLYEVWLPKSIHGCSPDDLNRLGFRHLGQYNENNVYVSLPPGWRLEPTELPAFNGDEVTQIAYLYLLDEKGRKRGVIARSTEDEPDSKNELHWFRRYSVDVYPSGGWELSIPISHFYYAIVNSDSEAIHFSEPILVPGSGKQVIEVYGQAIDAGAAWLFEHYPDWQDIHAYWD